MLDVYAEKKGKEEPASFTGKAVEDGGSLRREKATGYDGVIALQGLLSRLQLNKQSSLAIAIQGFGNVGYFFSEAASKKNIELLLFLIPKVESMLKIVNLLTFRWYWNARKRRGISVSATARKVSVIAKKGKR